jgi:hypothetical protein
MMCWGCFSILTDKELLANSEEDFIANKCLCRECLSVSNEEIRNNYLEDDQNE